MKSFTQIAIIAPTASGKTALSLRLAEKYGAAILSLDSLAVYREIDIASAKPTPQERGEIPHFGIDLLQPDQPFNVQSFLSVYTSAKDYCIRHEKPLIIVGGTGFYLKMLIDGMSDFPQISKHTVDKVSLLLRDIRSAYDRLCAIDPDYAKKIALTDRYRIEKGLQLYYETHIPPTRYYEAHPPVPIIEDPLPLYEIVWERPRLRERIRLRTKKMLEEGLIDEVIGLEARYTRAPNPMKAIGIKETLAYLDGYFDKETLQETIATHTAQLAKRQQTFNKTQFKNVTRDDVAKLEARIEAYLSNAID